MVSKKKGNQPGQDNKKQAKERRAHKRWMLSSYFDTYEISKDSTLGYLADISYGGMMLISKHPVQTNIVLPLRIDVGEQVDKKEGQMRVVTRSVRCEKDMELNYFNVGLKLIDVSSDNLSMIKKLIDKYSI